MVAQPCTMGLRGTPFLAAGRPNFGLSFARHKCGRWLGRGAERAGASPWACGRVQRLALVMWQGSRAVRRQPASARGVHLALLRLAFTIRTLDAVSHQTRHLRRHLPPPPAVSFRFLLFNRPLSSSSSRHAATTEMARTPSPGTQQLDSDDDELASDDQTDPREVIEPVTKLIHISFAEVKWRLYTYHQMCWIFDSVSPARQWKRGTVYTDEDPWAEYGDSPWSELTETDDPRAPQQPYCPREHK